ncbi:MAG: DUF2075 domain-containing protein [Aquificae bacterium]|nr:DUF2075 domain-containing protein [Aquificota bacterium]
MLKFIYANSIENFLEESTNDIVYEFKRRFTEVYFHNPSALQVDSWLDFVKHLKSTLTEVDERLYDLKLLFEVSMPYSSARCDLLILGKDGKRRLKGVVVEHKKWHDRSISIRDDEIYLLNEIEQYPLEQAKGYAEYLSQTLEVFHRGVLDYIAFLPNIESIDCLPEPKEKVFCKSNLKDFINFINTEFYKGLKDEEFRNVLESKYKPSKSLIDGVAEVIRGNPAWVLIDEQRNVFNKVTRLIDSLKAGNFKKSVIVVEGGPGTGKSVVAMNLLNYCLEKGLSAIHVTKATGFTSTLRGLMVENGLSKSKVKSIFRYSHNFIHQKENSVDVIICDEAHRFQIRTNIRGRITSDEPQALQIIRTAKISIFFLDENQMVRPDESGTVEHIMKCAQRLGASVYKYKLNTQFRFNGNNKFVKWLDYMLELSDERVLPDEFINDFEFKIVDDIFCLEALLGDKIEEGYSARIVAGFVWKWGDPDRQGNLPKDVKIGTWRKPWNRKRKKEPSDLTKDPYFEWATRKYNQLEEVGCVYSSQGFEFDYVGVIWGNDLVYRKGVGWIPQVQNSYDPAIKRLKNEEKALELLKNTYRVLMSRGLKGCFVYFLDKNTERLFVESLSNINF